MDLPIKDIVYILTGFCALLVAAGSGIYYLMKTKFVLKTDLETFCEARRDACNTAFCGKIDKLDGKIDEMKKSDLELKLWLVEITTLIADQVKVPIERIRMPRQ